MATHGPEALFEEVENLIPDPWKEHIKSFPLTAVLIGVGVGVFLGMKKGDEFSLPVPSLVAGLRLRTWTAFLGPGYG